MTAPERERRAFVSGGFGLDESVFDRFGRSGPAPERSRVRDDDDSYRVEVDRYWRQTASRRRAAEARRADSFARADRAVARARRAEREDRGEREDRAKRAAQATRERGSSSAVAMAAEFGAEPGDPYRDLLSAWARSNAQEPKEAKGRRTVMIRGQGAEGVETRNGTRGSKAERHLQLPRHERAGFQPDRVAMWAVLLGMVMVLAAAATAHATVLVHHIH
jgi:hypothetical protein